MVTALPSINAANTDFSTLVAQCWPHSSAALTRSGDGLASHRTFYDTGTADETWRRTLNLTETLVGPLHETSTSCTLRDITLTINHPELHLQASRSRPERTAPRRTWLTRLHLTSGDSVQSVTTSGVNVPHVLHEKDQTSLQRSILPGFGTGASTLGDVVEVELQATHQVHHLTYRLRAC